MIIIISRKAKGVKRFRMYFRYFYQIKEYTRGNPQVLENLTEEALETIYGIPAEDARGRAYTDRKEAKENVGDSRIYSSNGSTVRV